VYAVRCRPKRRYAAHTGIAVISAAKFNVRFELGARHSVAQLVQALRYKPEGHEFDSRWCHWNFFYRRDPFCGVSSSTRPLTEIRPRGVKASGAQD